MGDGGNNIYLCNCSDEIMDDWVKAQMIGVNEGEPTVSRVLPPSRVGWNDGVSAPGGLSKVVDPGGSVAIGLASDAGTSAVI